MPIDSPLVQSLSTPGAVPFPSLGQPCNISNPLGAYACTGDGPGCISSLWRPLCISGVYRTQPPCNGTGCAFQAGSPSTTTKSIESSSVTPSATIWTPGEPMSSIASGLLSPGMRQSSQVVPGSYDEPWPTCSDMRSCPRFDGMDGRSWVPPCSSCLGVSCLPSSAEVDGTPSISCGNTPMHPLRGSSLIASNSPTPWPLPTAPYGIWNGGLYDYYGRAIRLPSHARVPSVPHSSGNSLMQPLASHPPPVAPAQSRAPLTNPPTPISRMSPLSAPSRLRWRNQNRWRYQQQRVIPSTMGAP